jgi:lipoic acid synthetase
MTPHTTTEHQADGRRRRLPKWFKRPLGKGEDYTRVKGLVQGLDLHTVCQEARCPNQGECWTIGTATFMILGDVCTRGCRYCAVSKGKPPTLDLDEPQRLAQAVRDMDLRHVVITSVDRDDLDDGGAAIWAECIRRIREVAPGTAVEVLIPDFRNAPDSALEAVMAERPDILNHNIETVPRLFPVARKGGDYEFSLDVLRRAKALQPDIPTKSGMMVGLGETDPEILQVLHDLRAVDVDIVTIGQYLAPEQSAFYLPVDRFVTPEEFVEWTRTCRRLGFKHGECGPLVRSSYHAEQQAMGQRPSDVLGT